jgi:hypothetical protein
VSTQLLSSSPTIAKNSSTKKLKNANMTLVDSQIKNSLTIQNLGEEIYQDLQDQEFVANFYRTKDFLPPIREKVKIQSKVDISGTQRGK